MKVPDAPESMTIEVSIVSICISEMRMGGTLSFFLFLSNCTNHMGTGDTDTKTTLLFNFFS